MKNSLHTLGILCYIVLIVGSVAGGLAWMGGYWDKDDLTSHASLTRAAYTLEEELIEIAYRLPTLSKPVVIRVLTDKPIGSDEDTLAYTSSDDERYTIIIYYESEITKQFYINSLIHEYAHAFVWDIEPQRALSHDSCWGVAYAQMYRILIEEPLVDELIILELYEQP